MKGWFFIFFYYRYRIPFRHNHQIWRTENRNCHGHTVSRVAPNPARIRAVVTENGRICREHIILLILKICIVKCAHTLSDTNCRHFNPHGERDIDGATTCVQNLFSSYDHRRRRSERRKNAGHEPKVDHFDAGSSHDNGYSVFRSGENITYNGRGSSAKISCGSGHRRRRKYRKVIIFFFKIKKKNTPGQSIICLYDCCSNIPPVVVVHRSTTMMGRRVKSMWSSRVENSAEKNRTDRTVWKYELRKL